MFSLAMNKKYVKWEQWPVEFFDEFVCSNDSVSPKRVYKCGRPAGFRCVSNWLIYSYFCTQTKHTHSPLLNQSALTTSWTPKPNPPNTALLTCTLKWNMHGLWCLQPKEALTLSLTLLAASAAPCWRKTVGRHKQTNSNVFSHSVSL